jgi:hypothetical protein
MNAVHFNQNHLTPRFAALLAKERIAPLGPGTPDEDLRAELSGLNAGDAFLPHRVIDKSMAQAVLAGLWLYHDFLDESHRISQNIPGSTGSYWHGLMHRREPDSWNSKYWFERVGPHPIFPMLCECARELAETAPPLVETDFLRQQTQWNPFLFVDLCESAREGRIPSEALCREIQMIEWRLLFDFCYRHAVGI